MKKRSQGKSISATKKTIIILLLITAFCLFLEPSLRDKLTFAVNYLDNPAGKIANSSIPQQKSHAPEPSTLFLMLSGLGGIILRFARRSFEKFKRVSDIYLAILGLTVTAPILLFAALLIKFTSKGPVIYKQNRVGKNGGVFQIYKLRTMCVDAEKNSGAVWAKKNDPRITSVGRILRKTHIDEIPQLFNVLIGEMSIVGPRPERPEMVRDLKVLILDYEKRLQIKPGITGLAQVWHKYDETIEDVKKKIKYDVLYIRKMCLWVDFRIMARTFAVVLTGKGAR